MLGLNDERQRDARIEPQGRPDVVEQLEHSVRNGRRVVVPLRVVVKGCLGRAAPCLLKHVADRRKGLRVERSVPETKGGSRCPDKHRNLAQLRSAGGHAARGRSCRGNCNAAACSQDDASAADDNDREPTGSVSQPPKQDCPACVKGPDGSKHQPHPIGPDQQREAGVPKGQLQPRQQKQREQREQPGAERSSKRARGQTACSCKSARGLKTSAASASRRLLCLRPRTGGELPRRALCQEDARQVQVYVSVASLVPRWYNHCSRRPLWHRPERQEHQRAQAARHSESHEQPGTGRDVGQHRERGQVAQDV
mmetsp:Transcript_5616/g.23817  ORF Transcript_5616/g.23817 Transcript_5616/m.23817 type:complete len:310 (+) Transcript_5616:362-1291(+)